MFNGAAFSGHALNGVALNLHMDLPFLSERNKVKKYNKLVCNIYDKENCVVHVRALKQPLNHGLILKKVHRVIQFNQEAWLKPHTDMNTQLRIEAKNDFEKDFFELMKNVFELKKSFFQKTIETVRNHRDIKLVTTNRRSNELVLEPNCHTTKHFSENLIAIEMKKTKAILHHPKTIKNATKLSTFGKNDSRTFI